MLATIEFQISASRFAAAILSTLRNSPVCLPAAMEGVQLQRIRYRNAIVRNTRDSSFRIWKDMGAWDMGLPWEWVDGKAAQLALDVTLDLTTTAHLAANPNVLPAPLESLDATVVFDLTCDPAGGGRLSLHYSVAEIEIPNPITSLGATLPQWARDQVTDLLDLQPILIDLTESIASGEEFRNAGITADASGTRLIVRAEVSGTNPYLRWFAFYNGNVADRLGSHDWSLFLRATELELSLKLAVDGAIRQGLGDEAWRLISVGSSFNPGQNRATITVGPYIDIPVMGVTAVPIDITFSIDAATGVMTIDLDGRGIREVIDDAKTILFVVLNLLLPVLGWIAYEILSDALGDVTKVVSTGLVSGLEPGEGPLAAAPEGTAISELPGEPFRYRATVPVAAPSFVDGAFEEMIASADGIALNGRWQVLNFTEAELAVDTSIFGWTAATISCGASGERALRDFETNPNTYAYLYSQVEIDKSGSGAAQLCDVHMLSGPDATSGLQIQWNASSLPTTIRITAPASYANMASASPLKLEVRTSHGVFQVSIPHPEPMTEQDKHLIRSMMLLRLERCDAVVLAPWFIDHDRFDLSWIVDPLLDPDYGHQWVSLTEVQVEGLSANTRLQLLDATGVVVAETTADANGTAILSITLSAEMREYSLALQGNLDSDAGHTVRIAQELLEVRGSLRLAGVSRGMYADTSGILVATDYQLLRIDASRSSRPIVQNAWDIAGVTGVLTNHRETLVYGRSGLYSLSRGILEQRDAEPVLDAISLPGGMAFLKRGRVQFADRFGAVIDELDMETDDARLIYQQSKLQVHSPYRVEMIDIANTRPVRRLELDRNEFGLFVTRSAMTARHFYQRDSGEVVSTREGIRGSILETSYVSMPWQARAVRVGNLVVHAGDGSVVTVYRSTGPSAMVEIP